MSKETWTWKWLHVHDECEWSLIWSLSLVVENLCATTSFVNRALLNVGRHWLGKTSPRQTHTHLLTARTPVREDGGRDRDAPHVQHERCDGGNSGTRTSRRYRSLITCESQRHTWICWHMCSSNNSRCRHAIVVPSESFGFIKNTLSVGPGKNKSWRKVDVHTSMWWKTHSVRKE